MRNDKILHLLDIFQGQEITLHIFDPINAPTNQEVVIPMYNEYEIVDGYLHIDSNSFSVIDIVQIECTADDETRIRMIYQCDNTEDAFAIAKSHLTYSVETALDIIKDNFNRVYERQIEMLYNAVNVKINRNKSKLTVESVLEHLYINTLGTNKMLDRVNMATLNKMLDKIDEIIEKLNKEIF